MDKDKAVDLAIEVLQGAYTAALVERHKAHPKDIDDNFSQLDKHTQAFLLSYQKDIFKILGVAKDDFIVDVDPDKFIFDA